MPASLFRTHHRTRGRALFVLGTRTLSTQQFRGLGITETASGQHELSSAAITVTFADVDQQKQLYGGEFLWVARWKR